VKIKNTNGRRIFAQNKKECHNKNLVKKILAKLRISVLKSLFRV